MLFTKYTAKQTDCRNRFQIYFIVIYADVAELADAPDLGSGVPDVQVQVLSSALKKRSE